MLDSDDPYITPTEESHGQQGVSPVHPFLFTVLTAIFLVLLLLGIFLSQPKFRRVLDDFGVDLPIISTLALSPSVPRVLGLLVILTVVKELAVRDRRVLFVSNMAAVALGILATIIYLVGIVWPFLCLIEDLS